MAWYLLLLVIAVALGFIGVLVAGVFYLLYVGIAVFVLDLILVGIRARSSRRPAR
ncbi:MAG: hypothetical protein ACRDPH_13045 [Marmoricola sp.]